MIEVRQTEEFELWLKGLRDRVARAKILVRIDRLALGNPGDVGPVGGGISEMRIDHGPGYRLYFVQRGIHARHFAVRGRQAYPAARHRARQGDRSAVGELN